MSSIYEDGTYLENNPAWHSGDSEWKANQIFQILRSNHQSPRSVVEVGCGAGGVVAELAKLLHDTKFVGYDVSSQAIELAKPKASDRVQFILGDYFVTQNQSFDLAICADVIEHIDDYLGFCENSHQNKNKLSFMFRSIFHSLVLCSRQF